MSRSEEPVADDGPDLTDDELYEDDDEPDDDAAQRVAPSPRRIAAIAAIALALTVVLTPLAVLTLPPVSDTILLPRTSPDLLLQLNELPAGFRVDLDQAKLPDLGLSGATSQLAQRRRADLVASGFGGGWVRTFERDGAATGLAQISSGVSVYSGADGARVEYQRTVVDAYATDPAWKPYAIGATYGDESNAWEQAVRGGHAVLIYYRYANLIAQVSLTYVGAPDDAFKGATSAAKTLAQRQVEKERLLRFLP